MLQLAVAISMDFYALDLYIFSTMYNFWSAMHIMSFIGGFFRLVFWFTTAENVLCYS